MFRPASSTVPVTAAADQIEGGCAPAPAAHAVTSNAVMSDVRMLGIRFHLSCQRLAENRDREAALRSVRRRCKRIASAAWAGRYVRSEAEAASAKTGHLQVAQTAPYSAALV